MAAVTSAGRADRSETLAPRSSSHAAAGLYDRHSRRVFGYCLSRLGRREDAEDATQLTFLHAVRGLRRGVVPAAESAWLLAIARNVCLSRWASASRRSRVESACDPLELERLSAAHAPWRDELVGVEQALELLPEQQRRAVLLRDWRGLSYEEVAEQLGVSHAAVETLIFRGRAALAEHLGEQAVKPRRRLRSLGDLASLLNIIKGTCTSAAAGAKLAATAAALVVVSGGGIALGTTLARPSAAKTPETSPRPPAVRGVVATPMTKESPARVAATRRRAVSAPAAASGTSTVASAGEPNAPASPASRPSPVPTPRAELEAGTGAGAAQSTMPLALPGVEAPSIAALPLDASPLPLPLATLPSTDSVSVATDPIEAVVDETLASMPPLPAVPELPPPPPLPPVPPAPANALSLP